MIRERWRDGYEQPIAVPSAKFVEGITRPSPLVVAHRGDTESAPENTLAAFAAAIDAGADGIELDVHPTRDGALVVHHDYYLDRTTDGSGLISDHTLADLRALDAGAWFSATFAGAGIPTLEEVLNLGKGDVHLEIELKGSTLPFLGRVLEAIQTAGCVEQVELTTSHQPLLWHIRHLNPMIRTGMFFSSRPAWMGRELGQRQVVDLMTLTGAQVAHLPESMIELDFVRQLHDTGLRVHGANMNDAAAIGRAIESHVDQLSTSRLDLALLMVRNTGNDG